MAVDWPRLLELALTPSLPVVIIGILIVLGAPVLFHFVLASTSQYVTPPSVLLLGPEGSGKTTLLTLFERGTNAAATHTSQCTQSVELNASTDSDSKTSFRNHHDTSGTHTKFFLVDTPGHGKLRNVAMAKLSRTEKLRAVVFVVDAAALSEQDLLATTASYLYDVLLLLQRRAMGVKTGREAVPVLIAANKMDLFTAIPAALVKLHLETELARIRSSRSKGLLDSGVGIDEIGSEEQDTWLGELGTDKFSFEQLQDLGVEVEVVPGSVVGERIEADKWWWWIAQRI